tara:strand:- start:1 stop:156 length:156 start_codon:yes stop_codon:yes gene_type:complete
MDQLDLHTLEAVPEGVPRVGQAAEAAKDLMVQLIPEVAQEEVAQEDLVYAL